MFQLPNRVSKFTAVKGFTRLNPGQKCFVLSKRVNVGILTIVNICKAWCSIVIARILFIFVIDAAIK